MGVVECFLGCALGDNHCPLHKFNALSSVYSRIHVRLRDTGTRRYHLVSEAVYYRVRMDIRCIPLTIRYSRLGMVYGLCICNVLMH